MNFYDQEFIEGVRMTWNLIPSFVKELRNQVIDLAIHYSPNQEFENLNSENYQPLRCNSCQAILNPYCSINQEKQEWTCCICSQINKNFAERLSSNHQKNIQFSQQQEGESQQQGANPIKKTDDDEHLPTELNPENTTFDYILQSSSSVQNKKKIFYFLVDICQEKKQLEAIKDSIQQNINFLPQDSYIGLITINQFVNIHELKYYDDYTVYSIDAKKEYSVEELLKILQVNQTNVSEDQSQVSDKILSRFFVPLNDFEFQFNSLIDDIQPDSYAEGYGERPQVATGQALSIILSLLEGCQVKGGTVFMFLGNVCTVGPGKIIDLKYENQIRDHYDIRNKNENTNYIKSAQKFYNDQASRAISNRHVINILAFAIEQVGLMEMSNCVNKTGGVMLMQEQFTQNVFKYGLKQIISQQEKNPKTRFSRGATIQIIFPEEFYMKRVLGLLQPVSSQYFHSNDQEISSNGGHGSKQFYIGGLDHLKTFTFVLDLKKDVPIEKKSAFFQFQTQFYDQNGNFVSRITTFQRDFAQKYSEKKQKILQFFDWEAASIYLARLCASKYMKQTSDEIISQIDNDLINFIKYFSGFKKQYKNNQENNNQFKLGYELKNFTQFIYFLRRSVFVNYFGASPDEITYFTHCLFKEDLVNQFIMIQPNIFKYQVDKPLANQGEPAKLSYEILKNDHILVMDAYFYLVIWKGKHIKHWEDEGYQLKEEYSSLKEFLELPLKETELYIADRVPSPILFNTYAGHSKERYLKSRLSPHGLESDLNTSENYKTDDASLKYFIQHLIKAVVFTSD